MPALTYEIGARNSGLKAAVSDSKRAVKDLADFTRRQNVAAAGATGGMRNLGLASQQFSDVAVQLTSGTSGLTVLSQQGPQLASIFGTGGMILGGVVAIGAGLATWGMKAKDSFEVAKAEFKNFNSEVLKSLNVGGAGEIDATFTKSTESVAKLKQELVDIRGIIPGIGIALGAAFGGDTLNQRQRAIMQQIRTQMGFQEALAERRVEIEEKEVEVMRLRADGKGAEADEMQRQLKLLKELFGAAQVYRGENFERLKIVIQERSLLEKANAERKEQEKIEQECTEEAEKHAQAITKQAEETKRLEEALIEAQNRITAMRDERVQAEQELARLGETNQQKQNRLLQEYEALQGALHAANMQQLPEAERIRMEIAKKQMEMAENAVTLNKENLAAEKDRKTNMEALATSINAAKLSLENMKTENMRKVIAERLKTPEQRRREARANRDEERAIRQEQAKQINEAEVERRNKGWTPMTKAEKDFMRNAVRDQFKGKQEQQMAQDLSVIRSSVAKLADKVEVPGV